LAVAGETPAAQAISRNDASGRLLISSPALRRPPHSCSSLAWATENRCPRGWDEAAETVVSDEARYLADADLYVLTPRMLDVVVAAAATLTRRDLELRLIFMT
jgi:hypothetical protein